MCSPSQRAAFHGRKVDTILFTLFKERAICTETQKYYLYMELISRDLLKTFPVNRLFALRACRAKIKNLIFAPLRKTTRHNLEAMRVYSSKYQTGATASNPSPYITFDATSQFNARINYVHLKLKSASP